MHCLLEGIYPFLFTMSEKEPAQAKKSFGAALLRVARSIGDSFYQEPLTVSEIDANFQREQRQLQDSYKQNGIVSIADRREKLRPSPSPQTIA